MALSGERNTPARRSGDWSIPVAANAKIFAGALVVIDAGFAKPGATALNLLAQGRAEETVDNTGGAAGAASVRVRAGTFLFKNLGADPVVQADLGKDCFIVDDETVAKTNGANTRSRAGVVREVGAGGVWVEI
jgi:hypothetical protein